MGALLATACTCILLYVAGLLWLAWRWHRMQEVVVTQAAQPVSIIVAVRNEAENLPGLWACLLQQSYPDWEVVFVDDRSTDATPTLLADFAQQDARVQIVTISHTPQDWAPKKWAVTQGIPKAQHEHLLFTDADCRPPQHWASRMATALAVADVAIGYSPYARQPGVMNAMVRFDTWWIAVQYLALAAMGRPYMAVGRSLGYRKQRFDAAQGFATHARIISGDDDLFVQQGARHARVAVVFQHDAAPVSVPPQTWRQWWRQKRRHVQAAPAYVPAVKAMLVLWMAAQTSGWLVAVLLLAQGWWLGIAALLLLAGAWAVLLVQVHRKLRGSPGLATLLLLLLPWLLWIWLVTLASLLHPPKQWRPDRGSEPTG